MLCYSREHILEPGERIYFSQFARPNKAAQDCHRLTTAITANKHPVMPAYRDAPQRALCVVVVDREVSILAIAVERNPVLQCVSDRLSGFALWQRFIANLQQILFQLCQHRHRRLLTQESQVVAFDGTLASPFLYGVPLPN